MTTYVALLRGINVGGNNPLPMKILVTLFAELGCTNVRTYIQSGNVIFEKTRIDPLRFGERAGSAIKSRCGFQPRVLVIPADTLRQVAAANPFPEAEADAKFLQVFFLDRKPDQPDLVAMEQLKKDSETFALVGQAFYLYAPDGIARSKLAARAEQLIGVAATARNWRTVTKLLDMSRPEPKC